MSALLASEGAEDRAPRASGAVQGLATEVERDSPAAAADAVLVAWRRKAADVLLTASVVIHLPVIILVIIGRGPPMGPLVSAVSITLYLIVVVAALLRHIGHRARLWTLFFTLFTAVALANLAIPRGPYAQAGLISVPIFTLVFFGSRAAKIAMLASAIIVVSAPLLRVQPAITRMLEIDPAQLAGPPGGWTPVFSESVFLVAVMLVLIPLHRFLLDALTAQCRSTTQLELEVVERTAAQRKMEIEMRERQRLEREIASIGDGERRRLGRDLHDGVCQQVTAALLRCQALERRVERGGVLSGADLVPLSSLLAETIDEAHKVALGLCPLEPYPEALAPALQALTKRVQEMATVRCEFLAAGDVRVPDPAAAQHLYRIAQEAVSNAVRHAHANRIAVELRGSPSELTLQVEDDGAGLPDQLPPGGMGLRTMAYRAQILEGGLTVASTAGGGTRITCRVPFRGRGPAARAHSGDQRWIPNT